MSMAYSSNSETNDHEAVKILQIQHLQSCLISMLNCKITLQLHFSASRTLKETDFPYSKTMLDNNFQ